MRPSFWIISTGTELAQGRSRDTNAPEIARQIAERGWDVRGISILPDDAGVLASYLSWISKTEGVHAIIMTGGLGPTEDDLTIDVLSSISQSPVVEDEHALRRLQAFAKRRGAVDMKAARRQVRVLKNGETIPNETGLAPGVLISLRAKPTEPGGPAELWLAALPGVPSEMRPMVRIVLDRLQVAAPTFRHEFHIYEEAESEFQRIVFGTDDHTGLVDPALHRDPAFRWGVAALPGSVKVFLEHETSGRGIDALLIQIREHYAERFLSGPVEELLPDLLLKRGWTLSVAESCTGGLISKLLTDRPGSSAYFNGGVVVYANRAKSELLGVPEAILSTQGAVSEDCARSMASGARNAFKTDFSLAITGIAGPDGGTSDKPVGTVFIAGENARGSFSRRLFYPLDRERVREYTARAALFRLFTFVQSQA